MKLQYIDIHSCCLKQEVQQQTIYICWISTKKMTVDKLTKLLKVTNFEVFIKITRVENKKDLLALIKREEELKKIL